MSKLKLATFLATLCLSVPLVSIAAGTADIKTEDGLAKMSWLDTNTARMNMPNDSDYMLIRDQRLYVVSVENGKPQVMDLTDLGQAMVAIADDNLIADIDVDNIKSIKSTGATEEIAGIKGDVYDVTTINKSGKEETKQVVLTDDQTANELTSVYLNLLKTMLGTEKVEQVLAQLPANKRGLLKAEDGFVIESISADTPDKDLFDLPAKPQSLQDLLSGLGK